LERAVEALKATKIGYEWMKAPRWVRMAGTFSGPAHFAAGEVIFRERETANRFYLIRGGRADLGSSTGEGRRFVAQTIGAGEVLGWPG